MRSVIQTLLLEATTPADLSLNPAIWQDEDLITAVRERLLQIATDFVTKLQIPNVKLLDVLLIGSMANYNWTPTSDLDVHMIVDFRKVDPDFEVVNEMFSDAVALWNEHHKIKIFGHPVELYVQNVKDPAYSSGVYSIQRGKWIAIPKAGPEVDWKYIKFKAKDLKKQIQDIGKLVEKGKYQQAFQASERIREKIKAFRAAGLKRDGEYAVENLIFKLLRREGDIPTLIKLSRIAYDRWMTLNTQRKTG